MPLRTRLAITFVAFFAVALIALEVATYLIVRQTLIAAIDSELQLGSELLQKDFNQSNKTLFAYFDGNDWTVRLTQPAVGSFERTSVYAQIYDTNGRVVSSSPNLPQTLEIDQATHERVLAGDTVGRTIEAGQIKLRELLVPLRIANRTVGILQVARSMSETDRALQVLFYALIGAGLIVLFAAARGGVWLTRAALRPIDQITETAQSIVRAEDLSRRVPVPEPADELQRLSVTINDLLGRMEGLFSTQRRFVADVSHELRTPLAAMQGNLDVLSRGAARDPQLLSESLTDMRSEVNRLIRMVNDLLLLAQSESGVQLRCEPVELDTLVLEVHRELRPLASHVQLRIGHEDQVIVNGDRDRIKQALLNLTSNAIQYTPAGGCVTLNLRSEAGFAHLSVVDSGIGIEAEILPQIFDRFYRVDRSRSRSGGGAGLGLAIVKWITEAHNGRVLVESTPGVGSTFTLLLPLPVNEAAPAPTLAAPAPAVPVASLSNTL